MTHGPVRWNGNMRANLFQSSGLWWCVIRIEGEKKRGCRGCRDCQKTAALSFYGLIPENSRTLFSLYSFLLSNDFFRFTVLDGNDFPHIAMGEKTEKIYFSLLQACFLIAHSSGDFITRAFQRKRPSWNAGFFYFFFFFFFFFFSSLRMRNLLTLTHARCLDQWAHGMV